MIDKRKCNCPRKPGICKDEGFAFRKVVIPASLGDDVTGKDKPVNGAYKNSYVVYEANGAQYLYDSGGIFTKMEDGGKGTLDFNELENRPKYNGVEMTGDTDIPDASALITEEVNARIEGDNELRGMINGKQDALTPAQMDAVDSGIDSTKVAQIATNTGNIADEILAREGADNNLQGQIDALSAASDVTDIVGTYAALQAYDTSKLKDNDIIKVLQDETHDDETTYYRWSTTTETFSLIGEEGPYYTKAAADQKFQDKLTAGAHINIDANNEISADYTHFTGATSLADGTAGLVPAPVAGDEDKALKGDGTWGNVSSQTIFYANLNETGNTRHIYKDINFTTAASAQDIIDANDEGQVILRGTSTANPTAYSDSYLQNAFIMPHNNDYEFVFLDRDLRYEYTVSDPVDTAFYYDTSEIQPKLTAGSNVQITGTTISATDTTYSNFTGTDGVDAGTAGLVPAPATTDAGKYLKADGTWGTVSGGIPTNATFWGTSYNSGTNKVDGNIFLGAGSNTRGVYLNSSIGTGSSNNTFMSMNNNTLTLAANSAHLCSIVLSKSGSPTTIAMTTQGPYGNKTITFGGGTSQNPNGYFNLGGVRVYNVAAPTQGTDIIDKNYIDRLTFTNSEFDNIMENA